MAADFARSEEVAATSCLILSVRHLLFMGRRQRHHVTTWAGILRASGRNM